MFHHKDKIHTFLNSYQRHDTYPSSNKNWRPSVQLTFELLGALILPIKINLNYFPHITDFLKKNPVNCINAFTAHSLFPAVLIHLRVSQLCLPSRCQRWCARRPSSGHLTSTRERPQAPCPSWGRCWRSDLLPPTHFNTA